MGSVDSKRILVIAPGRANKNYWKDIWSYRELFYILSWRDLKVRYKQTVIGASWGLFRPIVTTLIFTFVFNNIAKLDDKETTPYSLVVFSGMIAWQFFATALSDASNSLIGNSGLISKVYFPRIIVPASALITAFVDFTVALVLLIVAFLWFGIYPSFRMIVLPFFLINAVLASFGLGLLFSALTVRYRDLRVIMPFIVQFGLFISPVGYRSTVIDESIRLIYYLNPMVGVIDGFRWSLLGERIDPLSLVVGFTVSLILFIIGVTYFRKTELHLIDDL